ASSLSDGLVATTLKGDDVQFSISDEGAKINDSNIVATDIIASNGVIHVIDMVLIPPMNIVEIASGNPDFSILVEAVVKADLVDALSGDDDLTVFAPTNTAFEMLFDALGVSGIADLSKEALTPILLYHVLGGKTYSNALSDGQMAETFNGRMVTFKVSDMGIMVNESNISPADIIASNGVIHVIDKVLLPPADMVTSFTLVNAETNEDLFEITEGMEIDLSKISATKFNIRANVSPKEVGSVKFGWNENDNARIENVFPYALFGDVGGNYYEMDLKAGEYTVTATPYTKSVASGEEGKALSISFSVISTGGGVTGFTLIDAITDEEITEIFDGDVIHLTTLINIRADLNIDSEEIMSVQFDLNDHEGFRVERVFPYALIGDSGGDYYEWKPEPGMYTITASPILKDGTKGKSLTIKIELVDKTVGNSSQRNAFDAQNLSKDNLRFYPNPAIEQINLELKARENDQITIRVLDLNGRLFLSEKFKTTYNLNNFQLNVSSLQRGIYILSVDSSTQGRQLIRFIKD
uniref:fasciclin domain-containing protein n=1 Tax=Flexithrix dorotheae TaxID=70993 RepID=UPI0012F9F4C0